MTAGKERNNRRYGNPRGRALLIACALLYAPISTALGAPSPAETVDRQRQTQLGRRCSHGCLCPDILPSKPEERLAPTALPRAWFVPREQKSFLFFEYFAGLNAAMLAGISATALGFGIRLLPVEWCLDLDSGYSPCYYESMARHVLRVAPLMVISVPIFAALGVHSAANISWRFDAPTVWPTIAAASIANALFLLTAVVLAEAFGPYSDNNYDGYAFAVIGGAAVSTLAAVISYNMRKKQSTAEKTQRRLVWPPPALLEVDSTGQVRLGMPMPMITATRPRDVKGAPTPIIRLTIAAF